MHILLLGEKSSLINDPLIAKGHTTFIYNDSLANLDLSTYDFIISFGYRHIIKEDVISKFPNKIINMHISYLPYNRGADPNLWSYLENTLKGVTIHRIDKGLDTGDILLQKKVTDDPNDTLKTSYDRLICEIVALFIENIDNLLYNKIKGFRQEIGGSYHRLKDKEPYLYLLEEKGYNTPASELVGKRVMGGTPPPDVILSGATAERRICGEATPPLVIDGDSHY